jgi:hypothetical protein
MGAGTLKIRLESAHPESVGARLHVDDCFFGTFPLSAGEAQDLVLPIGANSRTVHVALHQLHQKRIDPAASAVATIHRMEFTPADRGEAASLIYEQTFH